MINIILILCSILSTQDVLVQFDFNITLYKGVRAREPSLMATAEYN